MAKLHSCSVVVIVLLMPMVLSCSNREAAIDSCDRGVEAADNGDYDLAIVCFTEAIRLDPNLATAYYNRGCTYDDMGKYDKAIADYNEAIRLDPKYAEAYYNRAVAYDHKGEYDRAIADLTEAIRLNPEDAEAAYGNRGVIYFEKSEYDKAIADFTEAIILAPTRPQPWLNRAAAYRALGNEENAAADERKAKELRK